MKRISLILLGTTVYQEQKIYEALINMEGMPTVLRSAIIFNNGNTGGTETINGNQKIYSINILDGCMDYKKVDTRYAVTTLQGPIDSTVPKILTVVAKDNVAVKPGNTLTLNLNYQDVILIISKNQGTSATPNTGAGSNGTGNSLIYVAGVDKVDSRNYSIYEVAQTIDQLYTTLTT